MANEALLNSPRGFVISDQGFVIGDPTDCECCKPVCPACAAKYPGRTDPTDPQTYQLWGKICECIPASITVTVADVEDTDIWLVEGPDLFRPGYRIEIVGGVNGDYCMQFLAGDPNAYGSMTYLGWRCVTVNIYNSLGTLFGSTPAAIGVYLSIDADTSGIDPAVGGTALIKAWGTVGLASVGSGGYGALAELLICNPSEAVTIGSVTVPPGVGGFAVSLRNGFCSAIGAWSGTLPSDLTDANVWYGYPGKYTTGRGGTMTIVGGCAQPGEDCPNGCFGDTAVHCITPYINSGTGIGGATTWSGWVAQPQIQSTLADLGYPVGRVTTYRDGSGNCRAIIYVDDGVPDDAGVCPTSTPPAALDGGTHCAPPRFACVKLWESRHRIGGWTDPVVVAGASAFCVDTTAAGVLLNEWGPTFEGCKRYYYEYLGVGCSGSDDTSTCAGLTSTFTPAKPTGDPGCYADDNAPPCSSCSGGDEEGCSAIRWSYDPTATPTVQFDTGNSDLPCPTGDTPCDSGWTPTGAEVGHGPTHVRTIFYCTGGPAPDEPSYP